MQILGRNFTKPVRGRDFTVCRLHHTHVPREQTAGTTWHQNLVTLNLRSKKEKKGTFLTSFFLKSNEIEIFDTNDNSIKQLIPYLLTKGQLISKQKCRAETSSKKQTRDFYF